MSDKPTWWDGPWPIRSCDDRALQEFYEMENMHLRNLVEQIRDIDEDALNIAAKKLRHLRLTKGEGSKESLAETVKSVLMRGLCGLYEDKAVTYILRHGIEYYLSAMEEKS